MLGSNEATALAMVGLVVLAGCVGAGTDESDPGTGTTAGPGPAEETEQTGMDGSAGTATAEDRETWQGHLTQAGVAGQWVTLEEENREVELAVPGNATELELELSSDVTHLYLWIAPPGCPVDEAPDCGSVAQDDTTLEWTREDPTAGDWTLRVTFDSGEDQLRHVAFTRDSFELGATITAPGPAPQR